MLCVWVECRWLLVFREMAIVGKLLSVRGVLVFSSLSPTIQHATCMMEIKHVEMSLSLVSFTVFGWNLYFPRGLSWLFPTLLSGVFGYLMGCRGSRPAF